MQTHASASRLLLLVMIIGVVLHAGGAASAADSTSGIVLHLRPELAGAATASFENVPTERALKRLFGADAQYVFRYDTPSLSAAPVEVWVWRERPRVAPRPASTGSSSNSVARRAAIQAAVEQQNGTAMPVLVEALRDVDPELRKDAAVGLTLLRNAPVVEALEALLHPEQEPELRGTVAEILATIASPSALVALRPVLADPDADVRMRTVMALINVGGEPGLALVQEAARGGQPEARRAVRAMEQIEHREVRQ
jgi:HEAT repeats